VPELVRDKILSICHENLAPYGVAYISYNTYPGWHMLSATREMMLYHTRHVSEPRMRITQARELLKFLTQNLSAAGENTKSSITRSYVEFLKSEMEHIEPSTDSYVFHEELEEINDPLYFHEFAAWAERHQLQYLSEANFSDVFLNDFPPQCTSDLLKMARNLIELEQYMDFLRNRTFRKTLLVHANLEISRQLRPERVQKLCAASQARSAAPAPDIRSIAVEEFTTPEGLKFATDHPLTKAALLHLNEVWPRAVQFEELVDQAYARLGKDAPNPAARMQDALVLSANLLKGYAYSSRLVELHTHAPHFAARVSERPVASPWARFQAQTGSEVTNLCHVRVELKGIAQYLLSHLDGTRDRAALLDGLEKSVASGLLVLRENAPEGVPQGAHEGGNGQTGEGTPAKESVAMPPAASSDPIALRRILTEEMEEALQGLARVALLTA
jgi:methyltransferase-like protein